MDFSHALAQLLIQLATAVPLLVAAYVTYLKAKAADISAKAASRDAGDGADAARGAQAAATVAAVAASENSIDTASKLEAGCTSVKIAQVQRAIDAQSDSLLTGSGRRREGL